MSAAEEIKSVKDMVSAEEWQLRLDLAATYRLIAMHGWDDMISDDARWSIWPDFSGQA